MGKIYTNKNVYEAFLERIEYIFNEFDNIYLSFSGGKDSGVLVNLVMDYVEQHGIQKNIGLFHQDFEEILGTRERRIKNGLHSVESRREGVRTVC